MKVKHWKFWTLFLLLFSTPVLANPTVTFTADKLTGASPLTVVLTWSSTNATACTASGGWTGTKTVSGTETISNITANRAFTLTCNGAGAAVLTWVAPTKNVDGTTLTNLSGYQVLHAATSAGVATATPISITGATTLTHTVTGLAVGTRYFGVKAVAGTAISDLSNIASKAILTSAVANLNVTVTTVPEPPVLTVVETTAYTVVKRVNAFALLRVGDVPLGTPCLAEETIKGYYVVPREVVTWAGSIKPDVVVAKCLPSSEVG
jgi:hypothetical protein